jgi:protoporphyrinogen oxidase
MKSLGNSGMLEVDFLIAGGGITGSSAALSLNRMKKNYLLLERENQLGGHAKPHLLNGYLFDEGPHIYFGSDSKISEFLGAPQVDAFDNLAVIGNLWKGKLLNHPAHLDFQGIKDFGVIQQIVDDLLNQTPMVPTNYKEWLINSLGAYTHDNFSDIYTRKYWRCSTEELGLDWVENRIHKPDEELKLKIKKELARNNLAKSNFTSNAHYLTKYHYDKFGFWKIFSNLVEQKFTCDEILKVDLDNRVVETISQKIKYKKFVSTIPLNNLIKLSYSKDPIFSNIAEVSDKLECTSLIALNLVISTDLDIEHEFHWIYNYDAACMAARISFPDRFLSSDSSKRIFRIQLEFYWNEKREEIPKIDVEDSLAFLVQNGIIPSDSSIMFHDFLKVPYANIIPTQNRFQQVELIKQFLKEFDLELAGRYGAWEYLWSHDSAESGLKAVENCLK